MYNSIYFNYMVDIYGTNTKEILNISRDYWNIDFEYQHSDYLKHLFEKHISKIENLESDLVKLTYAADNRIDFELSNEWENQKINGFKIVDILNKDGFYILEINSNSEFYQTIRDSIVKRFNDYIILEEKQNFEQLMLYALDNFCQIQRYNIYTLQLSKSENYYPENFCLKFYSKSIEPDDKYSDLIWDKDTLYYPDNDENIFESLWTSLRKHLTYNVEFTDIYLNKSDDKQNLLKKFDKLSFRYKEYWNDLAILSPYQVVNNKIQILDLDKLSAYLANRKNDLVNIMEYKKLYENLIIEIDKFKETPH